MTEFDDLQGFRWKVKVIHSIIKGISIRMNDSCLKDEYTW